MRHMVLLLLAVFAVGQASAQEKRAQTTASSKFGDISSDGKIGSRLKPADQLKEFAVPKDFTIELVVDEPLIINPITMTLDDQGRIIVSESHTYRYGPDGSPVKPFKNPVVRLEPKPDGEGFDRVVIADGFDDPVMGIAVKGDKLWLTANNYLYQFDYPETGPATNKKTLVVDKNKAWNPSGMYVLEWGPDGLLYMSVGDHQIALEGPTNKIDSRGTSGVIVRMNTDGSNMERLTQGFRVPYSFEMDPFGQLWLLSNGEYNPERFARVIPGVDYHCFSRGDLDNDWLAGNHPLAPPVLQNLRGAHTQLMRYYGAAYPAAYQGTLFLCNWGTHGFAGMNRAIFRYQPDERGQIVAKEPLVSCNDPHFRPSHIALDPDGNLLIADWYGSDDESDVTGRIWRLKYTGQASDAAQPRLAADATDVDLLAALGSPSHIDRAKAIDQLVAKGNIQQLSEHAASSNSAMGAASALWSLTRIKSAESLAAVLSGTKNPDPLVRRLALDLGCRFQEGADSALAQSVLQAAKGVTLDPDAAVRLEAAITLGTPDAILAVTSGDVAKDVYLRYQAASQLAKNAGPEHFAKLLASDDPNQRLAGLIAIDVACYERSPAKAAALDALDQALSSSKSEDLASAIFLVQQHADTSILPILEKLILRDDVSPAVTAKAIIAYRGRAGKLPNVSGVRFLEAVEKGDIALTAPRDHMTLLELIEVEGPTASSLAHLAREIRLNNPQQVKPAALALARRFGPKSDNLSSLLWPAILDPQTKTDEALDALATVAVIQTQPPVEMWAKLLSHQAPVVRTDAVRWWRTFKNNSELTKALVERATELAKADPELRDDLAAVLRDLGATAPDVPADDGKRDKADLAQLSEQSLAGWSPDAKQQHALLGKQVFERAQCTKCHTNFVPNTPLAPPLQGVGGQKLDYLIESILEPSNVIKTGFETEVIVTSAGKTLSGLVKDEGTHLRVHNADLDVRVAKADVETRTVQRKSIMPDGQEATISRREFVDLIAYLTTLK